VRFKRPCLSSVEDLHSVLLIFVFHRSNADILHSLMAHQPLAHLFVYYATFAHEVVFLVCLCMVWNHEDSLGGPRKKYSFVEYPKLMFFFVLARLTLQLEMVQSFACSLIMVS